MLRTKILAAVGAVLALLAIVVPRLPLFQSGACTGACRPGIPVHAGHAFRSHAGRGFRSHAGHFWADSGMGGRHAEMRLVLSPLDC